MTKEITKAYILQQLEDKMGLREFTASPFLFDETVIPVYNIEQHLQRQWNGYVEVSVSATGGISLVTIPQQQRRTVARYDIVFMGVSTCTVAGVYVKRINRSPTDAYTYLDLTAAQTVSYHIELPTPVVMEAGDQFCITIDGYTSPMNIRFYYDYIREDIR